MEGQGQEGAAQAGLKPRSVELDTFTWTGGYIMTVLDENLVFVTRVARQLSEAGVRIMAVIGVEEDGTTSVVYPCQFTPETFAWKLREIADELPTAPVEVIRPVKRAGEG